MRTTLYLLRPGATEANLAHPPRLQGRKQNAPLTRFGIQEAKMTRDFLASYPMDVCYSSPLLRAMQTAAVIAEPHQLTPTAVEGLTECDVGSWEGMDWQSIRYFDAFHYHRFLRSPAESGYPGGETFEQVRLRATSAIEHLLQKHAGGSILMVTHYLVARTYLGGVLGLEMDQTGMVSLDDCDISMVTREGHETHVSKLNGPAHHQGLAA